MGGQKDICAHTHAFVSEHMYEHTHASVTVRALSTIASTETVRMHALPNMRINICVHHNIVAQCYAVQT